MTVHVGKSNLVVLTILLEENLCHKTGNLKMTESQVDRKNKFKFSTRILN